MNPKYPLPALLLAITSIQGTAHATNCLENNTPYTICYQRSISGGKFDCRAVIYPYEKVISGSERCPKTAPPNQQADSGIVNSAYNAAWCVNIGFYSGGSPDQKKPYGSDCGSQFMSPYLQSTIADGLVSISLKDTVAKLQPVKTYPDGPTLRGVNLSGAEASTWNNQVYVMSSIPTIEDVKYFVAQGMNTFRYPFRLDYAVDNLASSETANPSVMAKNYLKSVLMSVSDILKQDPQLYIILDAHNYMRYQPDLAELWNNPQANIITEAQLNTAWQYIAQQIASLPDLKDNPRLLLEISNEPYSINGSLSQDKLKSMLTSTIKTIRATGLKNQPIVLDGNSYTGFHSWFVANPAGAGLSMSNADMIAQVAKDSQDKNLVVAVHQYFDQDYSGKNKQCVGDLFASFGSDKQTQEYLRNWAIEAKYPLPASPSNSDYGKAFKAAFIDWSKKNNLKVIANEFGAPYSDSCKKAAQDYVEFISAKENSNSQLKQGGMLGWTIWTAGHSWSYYSQEYSGHDINYIGLNDLYAGSGVPKMMTEVYCNYLDCKYKDPKPNNNPPAGNNQLTVYFPKATAGVNCSIKLHDSSWTEKQQFSPNAKAPSTTYSITVPIKSDLTVSAYCSDNGYKQTDYSGKIKQGKNDIGYCGADSDVPGLQPCPNGQCCQ